MAAGNETILDLGTGHLAYGLLLFAVFYESNEESGSSIGNASSVFEDLNLLLVAPSCITILLYL